LSDHSLQSSFQDDSEEWSLNRVWWIKEYFSKSNMHGILVLTSVIFRIVHSKFVWWIWSLSERMLTPFLISASTCWKICVLILWANAPFSTKKSIAICYRSIKRHSQLRSRLESEVTRLRSRSGSKVTQHLIWHHAVCSGHCLAV